MGLLRIAADMHWATDVLTGAVMGTMVGILTPLCVHPREGGGRLVILPTEGGRGAVATLWW